MNRFRSRIFRSDPISSRRSIPFYYKKSEAEFRADPYEQYQQMVLRQARLHLPHKNQDAYAWQALNEWFLKNIPAGKGRQVVDLGCGVGRLAGEIALQYPDAICHGVDYSFQMLWCAQQYWKEEKSIALGGTDRGFYNAECQRTSIPNLHFLLAKAEELPFADSSLDCVCSSFLLDRLSNIPKALQEIYRCLKPNGRLLLASPLNFQKTHQWENFATEEQIEEELSKAGFKYIKSLPNLEIKELLDINGNYISWNCRRFLILRDSFLDPMIHPN